jgi:hypothetical protein
MGGVGGGVCETYEIRGNGVRGCLHSKPKIDRLIKRTPILFTPINGVRSSLDASADTHARYGAVDYEGDGHTKAELYTTARMVRDELILAYPRLWDGNWHLHTADAACPNMSPALAAQFELFGRGFNALVGNGPDPLGKYKQAQIMAAYRARPSIPTPVVPGRIPIRDTSLPWTYTPGWFPYPGKQGASMYGPSLAGRAWYSGKSAGGTKTGVGATGGLTLAWVRGHIQRIQKCAGTRVTSLYNANTVNAVVAWQKKHGLVADGLVGPKTWQAMAKAHGQ